jgi:hypothetical protein
MHTVIDAPPLPFLPTGYPLLVFRLLALPSLNDVLYLTRKQTVSFVRQERLRGRSEAGVWLTKQKLPATLIQERGKGGLTYLRAKEVVFNTRLFCFVEIIRKASDKNPLIGDRRRDIYNPLIKGFIDGCTDAGLWVDDSEEYHTDVWTHYAGVQKRGRAEIRFYESA